MDVAPELPDLTTWTVDDLRTWAEAIAAERTRRDVLDQAITQDTALAQQYADAGGDVDEALDQIRAAVVEATPAAEVPQTAAPQSAARAT